MTATTWNPSDLSGVTLSGGNYTVSATAGTNGGARGTTSQNSGKWYIEYQVHGPSNDNVYVGFGTVDSGFEGTLNLEYLIAVDNNGNVHGDNGGLDNPIGASLSDDDIVSVCLDLDNNLAWFTVNGNFSLWNDSGTADPASGTGGMATGGFGGGSPAVFPLLMCQGTFGSPPVAGATMIPGSSSPAFNYTPPTGFSAWDAAAAGTSGTSGTWASTENTDIMAAFGVVTDSGTWASTENTDTWSTSSGFAQLGVESVVQNNAAPLEFTTNGPDRILIAIFSGSAVTAATDTITGITSTSGLDWQAESAVFAGETVDTFNMFIEIWWAYAHDQVTAEQLTVSYSGPGLTTTKQAQGFAVKGLNGNYNYPFDMRNNPLSWGTAIGAFFGSDTVPKAFIPYSDGPFEGLSTTHPVFASGNAVGVTLSGGDLVVTSTGSGNPNNYVYLDQTDAKVGGKFYFEVEFDAINGTDYGVGFMYEGSVISTLLSNGTGGAIVRGDGSIWNGTHIADLGVTPAANDIIGVAIDFDASLVWFIDITQGGSWNGGISSNPTFGVGGVSVPSSTNSLFDRRDLGNPSPTDLAPAVPFAAPAGNSSAQVTFNFGATSFVGAAPTGFLNWSGYTSTTNFDYPAVRFGSVISVNGSGGPFGATETFNGFTVACQQDVFGGQMNIGMATSYQVMAQNIAPSANDIIQQSATAPAWALLYDTLVAANTAPGSWESTEAPDTMTGIGYPGAFGIIGFFQPTEAKDIFTGLGLEPDTGVWASTEAKDIFGASGHVPVRGPWISTEATDVFAGVGIGLGENGTWASTEGIDTLTMLGYTPNSGILSATEPTDIFRALGAGVTQVRQRRNRFVT